MEYDIVILGGGEAPDDLKQYAEIDNKGSIKFAGRMMIEYVVDALKGAPGAGRILVMGPKDPFEKVLAGKVWRVEPSKDTMLGNLQTGLDTLSGAKWLLVATSDIPLITPEIVGRFIAQCDKLEGDLFYSGIEKKTFDVKYPTTKRTYAKVRDGVFTGGNLVLMRPDALRKSWPIIESAIAARKSPLKLVRIIGIGFLFKFIFRLATVADFEARIQAILGIHARTVMVSDPEIGIDVDKQADYDLVRSVLEK